MPMAMPTKTSTTAWIATKTERMGRAGPIDPGLLRAMRWRERLIAEGFDALAEFLAACLAKHAAADAKTLKPMIQKTCAMRHRHGTPRFLLRYIRALDENKHRIAVEDVADQAFVPPTVS